MTRNIGVCLRLLAMIVATAPAMAHGTDPVRIEPRVLAEFDVADDGDALTATVRCNGKLYLFVIDTGCTHVLYDNSLRGALGRPTEIVAAPTASGPVRGEVFTAPAAFLGTLDLRGPEPQAATPVACFDFSDIRAALELDVRGVIGCSFLRNYVFRIDPDRGKLSFLSEPGPDAGVQVPIKFDDNDPRVGVELPGLGKTPFTIDTGLIGGTGSLDAATFGSLSNRMFVKRVGVSDQTDLGAGARRINELSRIPFLKIAQFTHTDLVFAHHPGEVGNLLGLGFLLRYIVTFDLARRSIYLKPSKIAGKPDRGPAAATDRVGMWIRRENRGVIVTNVLPGGAASSAGVRRSDILLKVDGRDVSKLRMFSIYKQFLAARDMIRLTLWRNHRVLTLTLRLAPDQSLQRAVAIRRPQPAVGEPEHLLFSSAPGQRATEAERQSNAITPTKLGETGRAPRRPRPKRTSRKK